MKQGVKLYQAIGGLPIIRMLLDTNPSDYYKSLWNSCTTTSLWIGSVGFDDTFENLLRTFELTGFGAAKVEAVSPPPALATLNEIISLYGEGKLRCKLEVKEVASRAVFADPNISLTEAMKMMCEKRIRRLFLTGKSGEFISDRSILSFLFSPKALKVARDFPDSWMDLELSGIQTMRARPVSSHAAVEDVGKMPESGRDVFILYDEVSLVSRWDLVMKPWKAGQLNLSP